MDACCYGAFEKSLVEMILFYVGHPAHFHNVKNLIPLLKANGYDSILIVRPKDVLLDLVTEANFKYITLPPKSGKGAMAMAKDLLLRFVVIWKACSKYKVRLLIGTEPIITHVAKIRSLKSVVINEDDADAVPKFAKLAYPLASVILAPNGCSTGEFEPKTIRYKGYHELAYLSPKYFTPDWQAVSSFFKGPKAYVVLRFSSLNAHHDSGIAGIDDAFATRLIDLIKDNYQVVITSERELSKSLEPYRQAFHPSLMHHVLAFAKLLIGDSQTMSAEAMVLGTPSIRCNDFVGRLAYLGELERHYKLGYGVMPANKEEIENHLQVLLANNSLEDEWNAKRNIMLAEKIDVTTFWEEQILSLL